MVRFQRLILHAAFYAERKHMGLQVLLSFAFFTMATLISPQADAAGSKPDAQALLDKAESIRNPSDTYKVTVSLVDLKGGKETDKRVYESLIKEGNKTRVNFVSPTTEQGKRLLMIDNDMWFFAPKTAKPIRIAPRQRITGNAVYGDIAKLSCSKNYIATYLREEKVEKQKLHVLALDAIEGRPVTYEKVEYYIDAANNRPVKAIYSTKSGKAMRIGYFENYVKSLGEERPSRLRIESLIEKDRISTLDFENQEKVEVPDRLFDKDSLSRE
jgi:outer membrane lipoprotein-sorting protein